MSGSRRVWQWLVEEWQWPAASLFAGCVLLLLAPLWFSAAGPALGVVYLQLPVYMLHQWEEHTGDRFRAFVNQHLAGGREALTRTATFWINCLGVWAVDLLALYLAAFVNLPFGLIAIYLTLVNALAHIVPAIAWRQYNPGLWTALVLFLPVGGWGWYVVAADASSPAHGLSAGIALAIHVGIVVHVLRRIAKLTGNRERDAMVE